MKHSIGFNLVHSFVLAIPNKWILKACGLGIPSNHCCASFVNCSGFLAPTAVSSFILVLRAL